MREAMSNGIKTNSAEEIIDLTDLVSIGNGAGEATIPRKMKKMFSIPL